MADESCAPPGDSGGVPRVPGRWLDSVVAERLLSGAAPEELDLDPAIRDAGTVDEAARVVRALAALRELGAPGRADRVGHAGAGSTAAGAHSGAAAGRVPGELSGEAAALAAFRQARDGGWARDAAAVPRGTPAAGEAAGAVPAVELDAVRLGTPCRRGTPGRVARTGATRADRRRPVRFALVAGFAVGMLGGVTVAAATTGILPSPFGGNHQPGPTVSVQPGTSGHPQATPTPDLSDHATGGPGRSNGPDRSDEAGRDGHSADQNDGQHDRGKTSEKWWARMTSACQDYRGGKDLDPATEQQLEEAANGSGQVASFCAGVLGSGITGGVTSGTPQDKDHQGSTGEPHETPTNPGPISGDGGSGTGTGGTGQGHGSDEDGDTQGDDGTGQQHASGTADTGTSVVPDPPEIAQKSSVTRGLVPGVTFLEHVTQ